MVKNPTCPECDSEEVFWQGTDVREDEKLRASAYQCQDYDCREPFFYDFKTGQYIPYKKWTSLKESVESDDSKSLYQP